MFLNRANDDVLTFLQTESLSGQTPPAPLTPAKPKETDVKQKENSSKKV